MWSQHAFQESDKINDIAVNSKNKNIRDLYRQINSQFWLKKENKSFGNLDVDGRMILKL
jgi:hypothetical protein